MLRALLPEPLTSERERGRGREGQRSPVSRTWLPLCVGLGRSDLEAGDTRGQPCPAGPGCRSRHPRPRQGHAQDSGCRCRCQTCHGGRTPASGGRAVTSGATCSPGRRLGGCGHARGRPREGPLWRPLTPPSLEAAGSAATSLGGCPERPPLPPRAPGDAAPGKAGRALPVSGRRGFGASAGSRFPRLTLAPRPRGRAQ